MRLVVLGCAGSYPSADSACSSYLVQADDEAGRTWTVALDLGNGAVGPLQRYWNVRDLDAIAISHLHADHVADTSVLSVARRYRPEGPLPAVPLWGPAGTAERLVALAGSDDPAPGVVEQFDVHTWDPASPVAVGPLTLTPVVMNHSLPCFGVRVTGPAEVGAGAGSPDRDAGSSGGGGDVRCAGAGAGLVWSDGGPDTRSSDSGWGSSGGGPGVGSSGSGLAASGGGLGVGSSGSGSSRTDAGAPLTVALAYTGDTDSGPGLDMLATGADLLLSEAAFHEGRDDEWRGIHLTARRAAEAAARGGTRRLVLTHIPAWNDPALALAEARSAFDGPITLAAPGATFAL